MEGTLSSSLLCLLCCLLGAGTIQEVLGDQSTPATVLPSLPASTVPVGTEGAAATSDPEKSTLMVEQAKSVPTNYSHPMDHNLVTEKPTPAGPAFDTSLLPEEPVTLTHDLGQPSPTMKPDVNVSGDSMVTVDGTLLQRNQSAEYHERTPNASVPEGSTASSTTLLDTKRMTANLGSTQEMATAFRTSGLPDPKLASNTEMAPSTATDHHLSYTVSTALHSTRTPAGISKDAVPWAFGPTSIQQEKPAVVDVGDIDTG
ncbi:uncharacterized protein LOC115472655 isoform X2 [Microcaecilia unicolor]|uniref:Uncharacterized protein LOC115472655 isoform X2 n=1 Tax=Microcaecilia unicolor TaxID=1415580 RepID=A0A6P7YCT0_9AMPH|nr:uncharacterized protein LOC115472655 isoform X2 [Microcaecilia unicolor]